ncbi:MAG: hypothetical protein O3C19_03550 [Bacteroidetes bacterium]|nr:hypothetical protein [Bacteroidota bacterium]
MKQFVSILLIVIFAFAGSTSILHNLQHEQLHCDEGSAHFCEESGHHHCALCDVVFYPAIATPSCYTSSTISWNIELHILLSEAVSSSIVLHRASRAPPLV